MPHGESGQYPGHRPADQCRGQPHRRGPCLLLLPVHRLRRRNLASRIQGLTKNFSADILISDATRRRLDAAVQVEELPAVQVKGRLVEVTVYRVV